MSYDKYAVHVNKAKVAVYEGSSYDNACRIYNEYHDADQVILTYNGALVKMRLKSATKEANMFEKRHYVAIADILGKALATSMDKGAVDKVVTRFIDAFVVDNSRFKPGTFREAVFKAHEQHKNFIEHTWKSK